MLTIRNETSQPGRAISASLTVDIFTNRRPVTTLKRIVQTAFLACIGAVLVACGGGGSGDNTPAPGAGATGVAVNQGVVTGLGSVFVNGIEFSTTGATIKIDDNPGVEGDLKVGMVVKVRGTSDDTTRKGTATQVEARDILEGRISSVDAVNKTITVMGQTVRIEDNVTRLNDDDLQKTFANAQFQLNDMVEVHGFADDQGGLRATRVLRKAQGEFESKGFVTGLAATSFGLSPTPGGTAVLTVNFTAGSLPAGTVNGSFVEVKSNLAPAGTVITASVIHLEDKLGEVGDKAEVEGIVTSGTLANFVVNGRQVVTTSTSTVFEGGLSTDVVLGARLEAEGLLDANGVIAATKISFKSNVRIEADASAVTLTSLTVLGTTVAINQLTRIDNPPILNGSHVEVRAVSDRDGNIIATRIKVQGASTKAFLQGPVTAANGAAGTLTILGTTTVPGIAIVSDGNTEWRLSDNETDAATTNNKTAFFAQIILNVTVVKVKWDPFVSVSTPIKEAEIESNAPAPPTTTTTTAGATTTTAAGATTTTAAGATSTTASTTVTTTTTTTATTATTVTTTTTTTLGQLARGTALYVNCAGCHGPLATSAKRGATVARITTAIANNTGGMGFLSTLTPANIADIAFALQ